jgi:hypothetical protein
VYTKGAVPMVIVVHHDMQAPSARRANHYVGLNRSR